MLLIPGDIGTVFGLTNFLCMIRNSSMSSWIRLDVRVQVEVDSTVQLFNL